MEEREMEADMSWDYITPRVSKSCYVALGHKLRVLRVPLLKDMQPGKPSCRTMTEAPSTP